MPRREVCWALAEQVAGYLIASESLVRGSARCAPNKHAKRLFAAEQSPNLTERVSRPIRPNPGHPVHRDCGRRAS